MILRGQNFFEELPESFILTPLLFIEGLPGAGKSYLAKQFEKKGFHRISLDDFLPESFSESKRWITSVLEADGTIAIETAIIKYPKVVVEGVAATQIFNSNSTEATKIYIKEMSTSGGVVVWIEGEESSWKLQGSKQLSDIREYHRAKSPWLDANIIFERMP